METTGARNAPGARQARTGRRVNAGAEAAIDLREARDVNAAGARLLIVDDESANLRALCDTLGNEGYATQGFASPQAALEALRPGQFDLLLTDLVMPEVDGISLMTAARRIDPDLGAIVMTGNGTIDTAVRAMRGGALDYILKPFRLNVMLPVIARALDLQRLRRENAELQERERQRAAELATAYGDLESFTYSISHDLRGPLLFVKDFAQRLAEDHAEALGNEGRQIVRLICDGSRSMDEMIVGLLSFSRSSRQALRASALDMDAIVGSAVSDALRMQQGGPVCLDVTPLPPAMGDAAVIRHVWSNLIGNALKFSGSRAHPVVTISGRLEGGEAQYEVVDNGVGFDMNHAGKLFGVFKRLHSSTEFPGTGVGLAIVQRIVARHGGRVWADSRPGQGARFGFTLPAVPAG